MKRLLLVGLLCVGLLAVDGCSDVAGEPAAKTTGAPVRDGTGASASVGGVKVVVPAESVSGNGELTVRETSAVPDAAAGVRRVGPGVHVDLGGAVLKGPATVSFGLPAGWDKNLVPVVVWQDGHGGWHWLPTDWKPGQTTVTAETDHFSDGFLGGFDLGAQAKAAADEFAAWFNGRAGVSQPRCAGEAAARAKVRITSGSGDSVKWCLGVEGGKTVLKIANNRITYTEISYPKTWKVIAGQRFGISLEALAELTTTKIATLVEPATRTAMMVKGGETVEFSLPTDAKATVIAQLSFYSWALQAIGLALTVGTKIAKLAGITLKDNGLDRLFKVLSNPLNLDEWGKAAQSCLKSYTKEFTNDLAKPVELGDTATKVFTFAGTCTIAMGKVSAEESGPLIYVTSKLLDAVLVLAGAVVSAAELLVSIRREIWDSITSLGGGDNPIYILRLTPKEAGTTIVNLNPLDASGRPKTGYSVVAETEPLECSPFGDGYPSPSAVSNNIYACGSTATNADVCWIDPGADHAYCQVSPWFKTLRRFQLSQSPPKVAPVRDPMPWGLELATGTQCLRRIGGSWSGRPDDWVGAYSCEGVEFVVLVDINNKHADIDKSRPTWVVRIGELSDGATSLPAPKPVAVRTAYFASRG